MDTIFCCLSALPDTSTATGCDDGGLLVVLLVLAVLSSCVCNLRTSTTLRPTELLQSSGFNSARKDNGLNDYCDALVHAAVGRQFFGSSDDAMKSLACWLSPLLLLHTVYF
jgi:hypothetical protein